jgi:mRNA-degrading endonuclease RelE of RelBE toxin-antitoxin system
MRDTGSDVPSGLFEIEFTESALADLDYLRRSDQKVILDAVSEQLTREPLAPTRNRKPFRPNDLAEWELRAGKLRAFYDIDVAANIVSIKAVGWKEHNRGRRGGRMRVHATAYSVYCRSFAGRKPKTIRSLGTPAWTSSLAIPCSVPSRWIHNLPSITSMWIKTP